jgi:hypothetical protein
VHTLDLFTILCLGLLTGNELAVSLFVNPAIWKLNESAQAQALSLLARSLGKVMPIWYALCLVLLIAEAYVRAIVRTYICFTAPSSSGSLSLFTPSPPWCRSTIELLDSTSPRCLPDGGRSIGGGTDCIDGGLECLRSQLHPWYRASCRYLRFAILRERLPDAGLKFVGTFGGSGLIWGRGVSRRRIIKRTGPAGSLFHHLFRWFRDPSPLEVFCILLVIQQDPHQPARPVFTRSTAISEKLQDKENRSDRG